jgi:hypothetical protein
LSIRQKCGLLTGWKYSLKGISPLSGSEF